MRKLRDLGNSDSALQIALKSVDFCQIVIVGSILYIVNIAKLFWYQIAAKLLKYCQVSRGMCSRQFFDGPNINFYSTMLCKLHLY